MSRKTLCPLLLAACWLFSIAPGFAQTNVLKVAPPPPIQAKIGTSIEARLPIELQAGYHVNSNTPSDEYLIPLRLTWDKGALESTGVVFPKAQLEKAGGLDKPISVFTGKFELLSKFKVPADAKPGPTTITGKLRYQACNNVMCLPPKNMDVALQVDITR